MLDSPQPSPHHPSHHIHAGSDHHPHRHASEHHNYLAHTEHNLEKILKHNAHDFSHVYNELNHLRHQDPHHFKHDLKQINDDLHKRGFLPHLHIVEDDQIDRHKHVKHGYSVVADDPNLKNKPGNHTVVSTSHEAPHESERLRRAYHGMHYRHGHYNGWDQSVEGGGGAHGGYDGKAVKDVVPDGARKELIDKALQLAGLPQNAQYEAAVNKIVTRESSWDPNISNNTDINAQRGHPSTGLMQTIPSTFKAYALKGLDTNIHDPLSNLVAGIRYAEHRYHNKGGLLFVASRPGGY